MKMTKEKVFGKLFEAAEIAKFTPEEQVGYEASLKYYRDLKNVIDTAVAEGESKGRMEGKIEGKIEGISKSLRRGKLTIEEIAEDFEVTIEFILQIQSQQGL